MKKLLIVLLVLALCLPSALAETTYRILQKGDQGSDVLALKQAMYWLGYFKSLELTEAYNDTMVERVQQLQETNGLTADGIATAELQLLVFSGNCVPSGTQPKPSAAPTPAPTPIAPHSLPDMPALTEDGFLADADAEYIYENTKDGLWVYKSQTLSVIINRYQDTRQKVVWFETDIRCTPDAPLHSYLAQTRNGSITTATPVKLAKDNQVVLAITDDFFGARVSNNARPGVIVRNGEALYDRTFPAGHTGFPNLDTLAVYQDGSMKALRSDAFTAQQYLDNGATDVYAFGPLLISDGTAMDDLKQKDRDQRREPRCALGMIEPYHYLILTVKGRTSDSDGVYFQWMANQMLQRSVTEALNLDGGGTIGLIFMGKVLNSSGNNMREVSGIIGFGVSEQVK